MRRKQYAALPELNLRTDFVKDHSDWNTTNPTHSTCLPILGKENPAKISSKQLNDGCKCLSIIFLISNNSLCFNFDLLYIIINLKVILSCMQTSQATQIIKWKR